ncbi:MAG: hypothetical protein IJV96_01220 [Clostridia bacterium]|nr:hypothetical protein [Clostridia bacterium]
MILSYSVITWCEGTHKGTFYHEMHIFPHGPHGIATATRVTVPEKEFCDPRIARWPALAAEWMKTVK